MANLIVILWSRKYSHAAVYIDKSIFVLSSEK